MADSSKNLILADENDKNGVTSSSSTSSFKFLATTERLLHVLKVIPSFSCSDDDSAASTRRETTMECHDKTLDHQDSDEQKNENITEPRHQQDKDAVEEFLDEPTNPYFETLEHIENLSNFILVVLDDIRCWRHRSTTESSSSHSTKDMDRKSRQQMIRNNQLERQRDILQQQKQQKDKYNELEAMVVLENNVQEEEENNIDDEDEGDDNDLEPLTMTTGSEEEENIEDNEIMILDSWQQTLRVFHSLQVVTPILIRMLRHPRRNESTLLLDEAELLLHILPTTTTSKQKKKKKKNQDPRVWLFGEHVYDVCTPKMAHLLMERLAQIYMMLGLDKAIFFNDDENTATSPNTTTTTEELIGICQRTVETIIQKAQALNEADMDVVLTPQECPLPFDGMPNAKKLYQMSHDMDVQYNLTKPLNDAQDYEQYQTSIQNLHSTLERVLTKRFPTCRLTVYGSCLSDLSLGQAADVDLSLCIPEMAEAKRQFEAGEVSANDYQSSVKKKVFLVNSLLGRRTDFTDMHPIHRARVPVIKGTYVSAENPFSLGGAIDFDICFLNDIAVANSSLLREYSLVDARIKQLMIAVKRWAKANQLSSAQDNFLSSYTWMNLVVYYVLRLGLAPNLQSKRLAELAGIDTTNDNEWHHVNNLDTFFLKWSDASSVWTMPDRLKHLSVTALLYGFFRFYTQDFPIVLSMISIKRVDEPPMAKWKGFRRISMFLSIEDPFETYDCHMPHDLGRHAGDNATIVILERLHSAKDHLLRILQADKSPDEEPYIWPVVDPLLANGNSTKTSNRGRNRKQQQHQDKQQSNQPRRGQRGRNNLKGSNKPNNVNRRNSSSKTKMDQATIVVSVERGVQSNQMATNKDPDPLKKVNNENKNNNGKKNTRRKPNSRRTDISKERTLVAATEATTGSNSGRNVSSSGRNRRSKPNSRQNEMSESATERAMVTTGPNVSTGRNRRPNRNDQAMDNRDHKASSKELKTPTTRDDGVVVASEINASNEAKNQNRRRNHQHRRGNFNRIDGKHATNRE